MTQRWAATHRWAAVVLAVALLSGAAACTTKQLDVEAVGTTTTSDSGRKPTSTTTPVTATSTITTEPVAPAERPGIGSLAGACPTQAEFDSYVFEDMDGASAAEVAGALDWVARYVPPELAADYEILRRAALSFFTAIEAVGTVGSQPTAEQQADLYEAFAMLEDPAVLAASEAIEHYFDTTCPELGAWSGDGSFTTIPN